MENLDDFLEVDDSEILTGDQHLKIQSPIAEVKREVEDKANPKGKVEFDDDDLIEIPDTIDNDDDSDDDKDIVIKKKGEDVKVKNTETQDDEPVKFDNEFIAFASSLNEGGFFPDLDEEELVDIKNEEDLQEKLAKQLNITFSQWQENYKQSLVDNLVKEGIIKKGEVIKDFITEYTKDDIKGDLELAKKVHEEYGQIKRLSSKQVQRLINSTDDLEESALELYDEIAEYKKQKQQSAAAKIKEQEQLVAKQREQFTEELKKNTFAYDEFIPGRKLRKQDKEDIFSNIEPVLKKINSNLAKYAPILSLLDRYDILEGKFDKIIKEGKTQAVSSLEQILKEKKRGSTVSEKSRSGVINIDDTGVKRIYK